MLFHIFFILSFFHFFHFLSSFFFFRFFERKNLFNFSFSKGKSNGGTVCVESTQVLDSETAERRRHARKVGNCVSCAVGCGRMRSHFRLDPATGPGGSLSVDRVPGIWPAPDDSQFIVTRAQLLIIKLNLQKKSRPLTLFVRAMRSAQPSCRSATNR